VEGVLVATDFSQSSAPAIRRGGLLARRLGAPLRILHVVDSDHGRVQGARVEAFDLLARQGGALKDIAGIEWDTCIAEGQVGEQIARTGDDIHAAVTVIGRHRYRWLHDFFLSGAAERIIKATSRPLLLANLIPSGEYRKLLVPIKMSVSSAAALAALKKLELGKTANISVLHVFDSGVTQGRTGAHMSHEKIRSRLSGLEADAKERLSDFLSRHGIKPDQTLIRTGLVL
jgi:universal stress protein E